MSPDQFAPAPFPSLALGSAGQAHAFADGVVRPFKPRLTKEQLMNRYTATGFLTRDPEQRELPSGTTVCQMRLAVKGMGPNYATGYIDVAAFGKLSDNCSQYLHKGSQIAVDGRLEHREWGEPGSRRQAHTVIAQEVQFLDRKPTNGDNNPADADEPADGDDIDF
jgi:single-strand DNA-binding protein